MVSRCGVPSSPSRRGVLGVSDGPVGVKPRNLMTAQTTLILVGLPRLHGMCRAPFLRCMDAPSTHRTRFRTNTSRLDARYYGDRKPAPPS